MYFMCIIIMHKTTTTKHSENIMITIIISVCMQSLSMFCMHFIVGVKWAIRLFCGNYSVRCLCPIDTVLMPIPPSHYLKINIRNALQGDCCTCGSYNSLLHPITREAYLNKLKKRKIPKQHRTWWQKAYLYSSLLSRSAPPTSTIFQIGRPAFSY